MWIDLCKVSRTDKPGLTDLFFSCCQIITCSLVVDPSFLLPSGAPDRTERTTCLQGWHSWSMEEIPLNKPWTIIIDYKHRTNMGYQGEARKKIVGISLRLCLALRCRHPGRPNCQAGGWALCRTQAEDIWRYCKSGSILNTSSSKCNKQLLVTLSAHTREKLTSNYTMPCLIWVDVRDGIYWKLYWYIL